MTRFVMVCAGAAVLFSGAAFAEPVTGKLAKSMMYATTGTLVELVPNSAIKVSVEKIIEAVAEQQPWYAAIALSPDEDIMISQATVAGAQFHDTDAAAAFALAGCEAKRTGESPCVVVALVRPKGWKARDVQLSLIATEFFKTEYLPADAPKAMAISPATGLWGFATGDGAADAAIADCAVKGQAVNDCAVVIADDR